MSPPDIAGFSNMRSIRTAMTPSSDSCARAAAFFPAGFLDTPHSTHTLKAL
jgi:hypothetical protein